MNYGLLSYEFKKHFNVGDYVQSLATRQYLPRVDRFLNRENLNAYHGEPVRLIMNGWFMFHPENWPPAPAIYPLFVAFHINPGYANVMLTPEKAAYLRKYAPIGCRDEQTRAILEAHGIPARCTGCLTLTLGRIFRWTPSPDAPVLLADVLFNAPTLRSCFKSMNAFSKSLRKGKIFRIGRRRAFLKKLLAGVGAPVETASCDYPSADYPTSESRFVLAEKLLERFSRARLVITSRIHVAHPCRAALPGDGNAGSVRRRRTRQEGRTRPDRGVSAPLQPDLDSETRRLDGELRPYGSACRIAQSG
jgi:hypothetical protein